MFAVPLSNPSTRVEVALTGLDEFRSSSTSKESLSPGAGSWVAVTVATNLAA